MYLSILTNIIYVKPFIFSNGFNKMKFSFKINGIITVFEKELGIRKVVQTLINW